jgi:hypothetical protein
MSSFPTSYIKTLGTAVTRSADSMTRTLGQEWNPNEGTFVVEFDGAKNSPSASGYIVALQNASFTDYVIVYLNSANTLQISTQDELTAVSVRDLSDSTNSFNRFRLSVSFSSSSVLFSLNGATPLAMSRQSIQITNVVIGNRLDGLRTIGQCNYQDFQYCPRAFDALTLQRLSRIQ